MDKLYKKYNRTGLERDKNIFLLVKIGFQKVVSKKKKEYIKNFFKKYQLFRGTREDSKILKAEVKQISQSKFI